MKAYVLIQKAPDRGPLAGMLRAIPGVVSAMDVSGAYDAIALVRSGSERRLIGRIVGEILEVPGVTRALPAPLIHAPERPPVAGRRRRAFVPGDERRDGTLVRAG